MEITQPTCNILRELKSRWTGGKTFHCLIQEKAITRKIQFNLSLARSKQYVEDYLSSRKSS